MPRAAGWMERLIPGAGRRRRDEPTMRKRGRAGRDVTPQTGLASATWLAIWRNGAVADLFAGEAVGRTAIHPCCTCSAGSNYRLPTAMPMSASAWSKIRVRLAVGRRVAFPDRGRGGGAPRFGELPECFPVGEEARLFGACPGSVCLMVKLPESAARLILVGGMKYGHRSMACIRESPPRTLRMVGYGAGRTIARMVREEESVRAAEGEQPLCPMTLKMEDHVTIEIARREFEVFQKSKLRGYFLQDRFLVRGPDAFRHCPRGARMGLLVKGGRILTFDIV